MLARKRDHVTPLMRQLHWLPMNYRCKFKVLILTFKILDGKAPDYLCALINRYSPGRQLRSSSDFLLRQPPFPRTKYGERAFCHLAPMLWNGLPSAVRHAETLSDFKRMLKSLFFIEHFGLSEWTLLFYGRYIRPMVVSQRTVWAGLGLMNFCSITLSLLQSLLLYILLPLLQLYFNCVLYILFASNIH